MMMSLKHCVYLNHVVNRSSPWLMAIHISMESERKSELSRQVYIGLPWLTILRVLLSARRERD